jgi:hypothetical protein
VILEKINWWKYILEFEVQTDVFKSGFQGFERGRGGRRKSLGLQHVSTPRNDY